MVRVPEFFDKNIKPQCQYCKNCRVEDKNVYICTLNKVIRNNNCPKFIYDPLMRIPNTTPEIEKRDPQEYKL